MISVDFVWVFFILCAWNLIFVHLMYRTTKIWKMTFKILWWILFLLLLCGALLSRESGPQQTDLWHFLPIFKSSFCRISMWELQRQPRLAQVFASYLQFAGLTHTYIKEIIKSRNRKVAGEMINLAKQTECECAPHQEFMGFKIVQWFEHWKTIKAVLSSWIECEDLLFN